ncbi:Fic family protein [Methanobacterium sp.]|uniref:Fic family protein n=1 Tax=Methanobacterium sp. TaxID=2164 RepID=UPI002AB8B581|nr:Fic family protein [Methanobacterium sp.]MDY9923683.1 Fic family protein [Methanobacterium sp.]
MFQPKFNFTNRIVKNLTFIAESRAFIINAPLVPEWEVSLRKDAILRSAHSSTAIEGNPLTLEDVSALADGREVMARRKDRQEVLNYLEALDKVPEFSFHEPLTLEDILKIHKIVTKSTLPYPEDEGTLRNRQVRVVNGLGETVFMPPETSVVPQLINEFLDWFNSPKMTEIDSVIAAGLTHYELVRIHPFIDGNGRTARIMATLVLYKSGFDLKRFFALDDYYDHDRPSYYAALQTVDPETVDVTEWLEYFTDGVTASIKTVRDKVLGLSKDVKILKERGQVALNDRQMKIVEWVITEGKITNRDVRNIFGLSNRAALDEISKLIELEVLKPEGKGRSIHYVLV